MGAGDWIGRLRARGGLDAQDIGSRGEVGKGILSEDARRRRKFTGAAPSIVVGVDVNDGVLDQRLAELLEPIAVLIEIGDAGDARPAEAQRTGREEGPGLERLNE